MSPNDMKRAAALKALEMVRPGMKLGLGTGSTAAIFVELLGEKVKTGLDVECVPTSEATAA
ncbi:ribose 5-phosphate isomerase A, partial [Klebsiella pneumoniae]